MLDRHGLKIELGDLLAYQIVRNNRDANLFVRADSLLPSGEVGVTWLQDALQSDPPFGIRRRAVTAVPAESLLLLARASRLSVRTLAALFPELLQGAALSTVYDVACALNELSGTGDEEGGAAGA